MKVGERHFRSVWHDEKDPAVVWVIDQRRLPFAFEFIAMRSVDDVCNAISGMAVRGAPLIGITAAWGIYLSVIAHRKSGNIVRAVTEDALRLKATRPTAVNLAWAVDLMLEKVISDPSPESVRSAAISLCNEEVDRCRLTGEHGLPLIEKISREKDGGTVNILTHCNAGWLACVDYGTALAPVYLAHDKGLKVHVWVDETRPRNQGGRLTAWELGNHGVPYTLIADNTGGHLMQRGMVDIVIVGCDRATINGDVANKIGTYLKALAAFDNNIPFYSAFPVSSFDASLNNSEEIPVEERDSSEVKSMEGMGREGITEVLLCPVNARAVNYGFDITPARLITGLITDKGVCRAERESIIKILQ